MNFEWSSCIFMKGSGLFYLLMLFMSMQTHAVYKPFLLMFDLFRASRITILPYKYDVVVYVLTFPFRKTRCTKRAAKLLVLFVYSSTFPNISL